MYTAGVVVTRMQHVALELPQHPAGSSRAVQRRRQQWIQNSEGEPQPNYERCLQHWHATRNTSTKVHRLCRGVGDTGIAVFADGSRASLESLMRNSYLMKLGWTVQLVDPDFDFRQGNLFGEPDWRHTDTESPLMAVAKN